MQIQEVVRDIENPDRRVGVVEVTYQNGIARIKMSDSQGNMIYESTLSHLFLILVERWSWPPR